MTVSLTISETINGLAVSDTLAGGSTGLDLGQVSNGQYAPLITQGSNTGHQDLFIFHDAVTNPITDVKLYIAQYSGTYGGPNSAAADFATLSLLGSSDTGATANNADGLSGGLHIDMSWDVATGSQFSPTREATGQKRIFGKVYPSDSNRDGLSLATAFNLHVDALSYWDGSVEADASSPQTGKIGKASDSILGNRAHIRMRSYLPTAASEGGVLQWDTVVAYAFTS